MVRIGVTIRKDVALDTGRMTKGELQSADLDRVGRVRPVRMRGRETESNVGNQVDRRQNR